MCDINDTHRQCDQIGRFFELINNKSSYKSGPNILTPIWAISYYTTFM